MKYLKKECYEHDGLGLIKCSFLWRDLDSGQRIRLSNEFKSWGKKTWVQLLLRRKENKPTPCLTNGTGTKYRIVFSVPINYVHSFSIDYCFFLWITLHSAYCADKLILNKFSVFLAGWHEKLWKVHVQFSFTVFWFLESEKVKPWDYEMPRFS